MSLTRRSFLKTCSQGMGAAAMLTGLSIANRENAFAQQPGGRTRRVVAILLEGGMDGTAMLGPTSTAAYNTYATTRGPLAVPRESLLPINVAGADGTYGLHPSMTGLQTLWNQGRVAAVLNVGNLLRPVTPTQVLANPALAPSGLFDHFQQQVYAQCLTADNTEGWGNRLGGNLPIFNTAPVIPGLMSVVNSSLFTKGPVANTVLLPGLSLGMMGLPSTGTPPVRFSALQQVAGLTDPSVQVNAFNQRVSRAIDDSRVIGNIFATQPFATVFPNTGIGQQLRQVAIAIAAANALGHNANQIFFAQVQGNAWDTHGQQVTTLARLFGELSAAMSAFYAATVELGVAADVTTFTFSEFGRTFKINGDGSDHGWAGHHLVMGNSVLGGRFFGGQYPVVQTGTSLDFPLFSVSGNFRGANIPANSMQQYGNTFARWLGSTDDGDIFPGIGNFSTPTLGFLSA